MGLHLILKNKKQNLLPLGALPKPARMPNASVLLALLYAMNSRITIANRQKKKGI